jgi:hypothetical protein
LAARAGAIMAGSVSFRAADERGARRAVLGAGLSPAAIGELEYYARVSASFKFQP